MTDKLEGLRAWIPMAGNGPVFGVDKSTDAELSAAEGPLSRAVSDAVHGTHEALGQSMVNHMLFGTTRIPPNHIGEFQMGGAWSMPLRVVGLERPSFTADVIHEARRRYEPRLRDAVDKSRLGTLVHELAYWLGYVE